MFIFMMIYLILVLIRPQDYPAVVDSPGPPLQPIVLITALLFWLLSARKTFAAPHFILIPMFLLVAMISQVTNGWAGGALVVFSTFAPVVLAFVLLSNAANTRSRLRTTMGVFAICAGVLALHGIEQSLTGIGWTGIEMSQETRIQYVGIFNDPNDLGMLFVMCLPMAFYLASRGGLLGLRRIFWWAIAGVMLYGIFLTDSRGTILGVVAMLGVYIWHKRGPVTAGVLGATALAVLMALPSRMQDMDASEESAAGRVDSWYEGLQMFIGDPLFGIGAGNYTDINPLTAHNSFVLVLAETGIIGFTIWLAIVGYSFRMMLAVMRRGDEIMDDVPADVPDTWVVDEWRDARAITLTLLLSLTGFFVAAFFLSRSYVVILYLLVAIVVAHYLSMRETYPSLPAFTLDKDLVRWPVYAVCGVIFLYVMVKVLLVVSQ
ncbi:MAG: O-antigen ligase family protein [Pseudoxanthomonas sp.]